VVGAGVVDTTGAGDAFAAGFLFGGDLRDAARLGLSAAARCVAAVGAMPRADAAVSFAAGAQA
jgi:sugar/nucleoside kinase (ribokinase family)